MSNIQTYILSWDCYGLESCINATELEQERIMDILSDKQPTQNQSVGQILSLLTLRARFNTQRHYEIYAIDVVDDIKKEDLVYQFEKNPQGMAELIRERGRQLFSDRVDKDRIKIV